MLLGIRVPRLRLIVLAVMLLAQVYLYIRFRGAIRASRGSDGFKSLAIRLMGGTMCLLFFLNGYSLFRHVPWVDPPVAAQIGLLYPVAAWNFGSLFSALILFLTRVASRLGRRVVRLQQAQTNYATCGPVNFGRRRFLKAGVGGLATLPMLLSGYGAAYAAKSYDLQELSLPFGRSVRIVQLTDIHAGIYMNRKQMQRYADQVIELQPDLFVLTGDFISNSMAFLPGCVEEMVRVRTRYGTFATLGNHEHLWGKPAEVQAIFRQHQISLLNNTHQLIQTGQGPFALAGIDDLVAGRPDLEAALRGLDPAIPTLLLSHHPEIFPQAAAHGIRLTLSGHYHGGQIKIGLPGMEISMAHFWTPYPEGLYRIHASHLYVSRGIGTTFTPVRLNAPPEVTVFNLT